jgi:hypothetical protein
MIIFDIDVLANHYYFKVYRQTKPGEPERKLMFAVLVDAVQTYQKFAFSTSTRGQRLFHETERWFWRDDCDGVFSFCNICDVFGLAPVLFRRGLVRWIMNRKRRGSRAKIVQLRSPEHRSRKPMFSAPNRASAFLSRERPAMFDARPERNSDS